MSVVKSRYSILATLDVGHSASLKRFRPEFLQISWAIQSCVGTDAQLTFYKFMEKENKNSHQFRATQCFTGILKGVI